jgi:hypothetical protein
MAQQRTCRSAASSFSATLNRLWRRGWFSAWPSADDGQSILYASFHLHPDDADSAEAALQAAIANYPGNTKWALLRQQGNRFVLCPEVVAAEGQRIGNLGEAAKVIQGRHPDVERQAAADLLKVVGYLDADGARSE